ncbi:hypothetical protein E2C01_082788 [Portunus trituberculatus]|uniref:Uncharacterized protein n=1 Tax=Portunus trituberculatus TaxID=210409 RepID=A0A5B7J4Q3_PORTR|nr:hypothetical protein [Portunus trituberculatus]
MTLPPGRRGAGEKQGRSWKRWIMRGKTLGMSS